MAVAGQDVLSDVAKTLLRTFGIPRSKHVRIGHLVRIEYRSLYDNLADRQDVAGEFDDRHVSVELVLD